MTEPEAVADQAAPVPIEKRSSFASDVLILVGGTAFAQALSVLVAPILTRLYAPDAFGSAAVFASITTIIVVVACLRYELAIMLPARDEDAANLLAASLCAALLIAGLSGVLVLVAGEPIVRILNAPGLAPYLGLVPLSVLASGAFLALNYWNLRTRHFGRLSIAGAGGSVVTRGGELCMGALGHGEAGGLLGARVLGSAVVAVALGGLTWRDDHGLFLGNVRLRRVSHSFRRYLKFPLVGAWGALMNSVAWQLPTMVLSVFFSQTVVGYYALANRIIQLPMALIGGAVAQVFFQRASEAHGKEDGLATTVEMVLQMLVAVALFPALSLAIAGPEIFGAAFGQTWSEAGTYAQILSVWLFFWFLFSPLSTVFAILERQELGLIAHGAIFFAHLIPVAVGGILGNIYIALALFAGSGALVYGGLALWSSMLGGLPLQRCLLVLLREGVYGLPFAVALVIVKAWFKGSVGVVLVANVVAMMAYYLLVLGRHPALGRILRLRKR